jgi:hypothetical protein
MPTSPSSTAAATKPSAAFEPHPARHSHQPLTKSR